MLWAGNKEPTMYGAQSHPGRNGVSAHDGPLGVFVGTMYGAQTREPIVMLRFGDAKPLQMRTEEARRVARWLLEAAESAEQDAFLVEHFTEVLALEEGQVAHLLRAFREHRKKWMVKNH